MTELDQFEADLVRLIGRPTRLRPFVCEGSPLECRIVIVGFNPATEMERDFWEFWEPGYGFRKADWLVAYTAERMTRPLSRGRTRRNPVSNTRRVLEWIAAGAAPERCLETNLYGRPTRAIRDLAPAERSSDVFDFLLAATRPTAMLIHGRDAVQSMQSSFDVALTVNKPRTVTAPWGEIKVFPVPHLSRGWSRERAERTGSLLRDLC